MEPLTARHDNNIENRATIFRIVLNKVLFQYDGLYALKLTISGSNVLSKRGLRLRVGSNKSFLNDYTIKTEIIGPVKKASYYEFELKEYAFYLPKGYCKNDVAHEVYLLIEAQQIDSANAQSKMIGNVKLPIYPRSDVNANYDRVIGEPFYEIEQETIRIIKLDKNSSELHCGDLVYSAEFSEIHEIIESEPTPKQEQIKPTPPKKRPLIEMAGITPTVEEECEKKERETVGTNTMNMSGRIVEMGSEFVEENDGQSKATDRSHADDEEKLPPPRDVHITLDSYRTLAEPGCEEISVLVHGARNVYNVNGALTRCYIVCLQRSAAPLSQTLFDSTHITKHATSHPYWGEFVTISSVAGRLHKFINILIVDATTDTILIEFLLPTRNLQPFLQHHLIVSQEERSQARIQNPIDLSITVIRKLDHFLPKQSSMEFSAIVVKPLCLRYSPRLLSDSDTRLVCMSYITNDSNIKSTSRPSLTEVFEEVQLPLDINYEYSAPQISRYSRSQLTIASRFIDHDDGEGDRLVNETNWNFPLVFTQQSEIDTAFTVNSAVVLEFYKLENTNSSTSSPWRFVPTNTNVLIPLNSKLFEQLNAPIKINQPQAPPINRDGIISHYKINFPKERMNGSANPKADKVSVCLKLVADGKMDFLSPEKHQEPTNVSVSSDVGRHASSEFLYEIRPGATAHISRPYMYKKNSKDLTDQSKKRLLKPESRKSSRSDNDRELIDRLAKMEYEMQEIRKQAEILEKQRLSYGRPSVGNSDYSAKLDSRKKSERKQPLSHSTANHRINTPEYLESLEKAVKEKEKWIRHLEKRIKH